MDQPGALGRRFRFGPYEVDAGARELRKRGLRIRLRDQSFEILLALLERPGEIVTREQLRHRLWPQDIHVAFDDSLNSAVNRLRGALRDRSARPKYLETVSRHGYRFLGLVQQIPLTPTTMAVLPFDDLSRDPELDFLGDAVSDALITELGNVSTLRVISRQSVSHLKGSQRTAPEIARDLKADAIVEGSVLQEGCRVRITAQLVQVDPEQHLWAKAYECAMVDILTTIGQVSRAIAEAVKAVLSPAEVGRLGRPRPVDPEAHIAYVKGRHHMGRGSREGYLKALEYFHQATEKDPTHALAYARMADCYGHLGHWGHLPFDEAFQLAEQAARKALALDDALSTTHWVLGWASWLLHWDLAACESEMRRAIQLNPSDDGAHIAYAVFLATIRLDHAAADAEAALALELAPLSHDVNAFVAWIHLWARNCDRAVAQAYKTLALCPASLLSYIALGLAGICRRHYTEAIAMFEKAAAISNDAVTLAYLGHSHGLAGNAQAARSLLDELRSRSSREHVPPRTFAILHAALNEPDQAFEWLEKAYAQHDSGLFWLSVLPLYDPLRPDPRFKELAHRMGLQL